jgi:starvation-inducible outer membrane lipoprotein
MASKRNTYIAVQAASYHDWHDHTVVVASYQDWLDHTGVVASYQDWLDHTVVVAHLVVDCTIDAGLWFVFSIPSGS